MTLKTLDFETGPEGATLTTANSGAAQINAGSGGSALFATDTVRNGTLGARFTSGTNALAIGRFTTTAANNTLSIGVVFQHKQTPTLLTGILSIRHGSGVAGRINWLPDNSLVLVDSTLSNTLTIATGLTPGTNYELTIRAKSASTTTGTVTAVLYTNSGTELGRATSNAYNLTANTLAAVDVGIINTNSTAGTIVALDYLQLDDGNAGELRAPSAGTNYQGNLALIGTGTLAQTATAATTGTLPLAGAGTVAQAGTAAGTSTVAFTGSGALTQAATAAGTSALPLSGTGALTETATVDGSSSAPTTGSGTLAFTATTNQAASLNLTATGSLDMATSAARTAAVALAGSGTFTATTAGGAQTARLDLTSAGALELSSTTANIDSLTLAGTGLLTLTIGGTDHHDLLELAGIGSLTILELGKQRDITVTATIQPRTWAATIDARKYSGNTEPRRWGAHADLPS
jgi:fibronectin-binding autotransporter adhesin